MNVMDSENNVAASQQGIITVENVTAGYKDKIVWSNANFSINCGEFVAVIGPNGAGKTTLFRLLLGLQRPFKGTISILNAPPRRGNQHIGYVPQQHLIDSVSNVECLELVQLAISGNRWGFSFSSKGDRQTAIDTLESVGVTELAHRSLNVLSGGEAQRIFLTESLVNKPEILLLDEPLANLDIRRGIELVELIDSMVRSRNVTVFMVAHDINPLFPFLDNVIYIANGKVATGKPDEVLTSERFSALYGVEIEVMRNSKGNVAIIGSEPCDRCGGK